MQLRALLVSVSLLSSVGCNLNKMAADQMASFAEAGAESASGFWDYEMAGKAMPPTILQGEAMVRVSPDNETLRVGLAKTYVAYAYGWLLDQWERADEAGDFESADKLEQRIMYIYLRARDHAMHVVRRHDDAGKLDEKLKTGDAQVVLAYLRENFTDKDDVGALYWTGLAWGSAIANSSGNMKMFADAATARQFLERSVELDPGYNDAGALGVLGSVEALFPQLFGGNLDKSKEYYERGIALCERKNHLILLGYARNYAVAKQDKALFLSLLNEIIDAKDQGSHFRLSNKVARHRAERYLQHVDDYFDPALGQ